MSDTQKGYTQVEVDHIKVAIEALPFVRDSEWVGKLALCNFSDTDADLLVSLIEPQEWKTMTDKERRDWQLEICKNITIAIGEKEGTCWGYGATTRGIAWLSVQSKESGGEIIQNMAFITPDGFVMDLWFVIGIPALEGVNHDYFADKVKWRIDGGCP